MGRHLIAWAERRQPASEEERARAAQAAASHLPAPTVIVRVRDEDLNAMKAAFVSRFDEDLPRTETLYAVAMVGYRMALRDAAQAPSEEAQ